MVAIADMPRGIDVSKFQTVDWQKAKDAGITFGFARAINDRAPGDKPDPKFAQNFAGMKAAGVFRGAYYFLRPKRDTVAAANLFVSTVGPLGEGDLPPVIDVEVQDGVSATKILNKVAQWIEIVEAALSRQVIIYTFTPFWRDTLGNSDRFKDQPLWIAHFTTAAQPNFPSAFPGFAFWQHTDKGNVAGVTNPPKNFVDLDRFNGSMEGLRKFAGFP